MPPLIEETNNILAYANSLNVNMDTFSLQLLAQQMPINIDPAQVDSQVKAIQKGFLKMLGLLFIIYFVAYGMQFVFLNKIFNKEKMRMSAVLRFFSVYFFVALIVFLSLGAFWFSAMTLFAAQYSVQPIMISIVILIVSLILLFFFQLMVPLIGTNSLKKILKETAYLGINKWPIIAMIYLIVLIGYGILIAPMILFVESHAYVALISLIGLIIWSVVAKILLFQGVHSLRNH